MRWRAFNLEEMAAVGLECLRNRRGRETGVGKLEKGRNLGYPTDGGKLTSTQIQDLGFPTRGSTPIGLQADIKRILSHPHYQLSSARGLLPGEYVELPRSRVDLLP